MTRPYLDIGESLSGRVWRDGLDDGKRAQALAMVQEHGIPDIVARVLAARDVVSTELPSYLEPRLRDLMPDPSTLLDMDRAASRLADAAEAKEKIAIFGDYDVDGACSSALLAGWCDALGLQRIIHIPDRITEGYGPNSDAIAMLAASGATLLVTVDCGTTSHGPLTDAKRLGMDVVVLDHHQAPVELPDAVAIVNPNRQDDLSALGHLCAAGVVFMALVAATRVLRGRGFFKYHAEPDLIACLDLVALGTVADVVPLKGLNRAFVRKGLQIMRARSRIGLRALMDVSGLDGPVTPFHLGFLIGPRINAGGRIGDAALGARLMLTHDEGEANAIAIRLNQLNRERQEIEAAMVADAEAMALAQLGIAEDRGSVIVVASKDWHPGVVGLVASRLKERFRRPAFAIALDGQGSGTGSGRSVPGVDLGRAVRASVDAGLAIKGGGHAMAAGVTVAESGIDAFLDFLESSLASAAREARATYELVIDGALAATAIRPELISEIEKAGPFGAAQPEPVFVLPSHGVVDAHPVGQSHIRLRLKSADGTMIGGIAFRSRNTSLGDALLKGRGAVLHFAAHLAIDRYGGGERPQIRVIDAAYPVR